MLPYDSPGQSFVAFVKLTGVPAIGRFSNILKFIVKEVDPSTGEAEDEEVEDEYQLEDFEVMASDYMVKVSVSNFKNAWDNMGPDAEQVDEYGLGTRESLAEAVSIVISVLGMQPCEDLDHAKQRGAKIYAEVQGYGMSGDAHHITQPQNDERGATLAMASAIQQIHGYNSKEDIGTKIDRPAEDTRIEVETKSGKNGYIYTSMYELLVSSA